MGNHPLDGKEGRSLSSLIILHDFACEGLSCLDVAEAQVDGGHGHHG